MNTQSPRIAILILAMSSLLTFAAGDVNIDWDRAKNLYQRSQRGEQLSPDDRKYLDHAKEVRAATRADGGSGGQENVKPAAAQTGLIPLPDMTDKYKGEDGGLYGAGRNDPPADLAAAAKAQTAKIQPLDAEGKPSPGGKIVLLSIGMSNTTMEFSQFAQMAQADPGKSPQVVVVDGAQGGQSADRIASEDVPFWGIIDQRLKAAGVTPAQVQVAWVKQAIPRPEGGFPDAARRLKDYLATDVAIAKKRYPNLAVVYFSSRIYGGYATTPLNPEPYAYEGAFAVRWLIEDQIKAGIKSPVLLWGPYLWADGIKGRKGDSLIWTRADFGGDGTHPSPLGRQKVAGLLLKFFKTDTNARTWFVKK